MRPSGLETARPKASFCLIFGWTLIESEGEPCLLILVEKSSSERDIIRQKRVDLPFGFLHRSSGG